MDTNLIPIIISIVISIIGYFLKETMSTLKEVQKMTIENKAKIEVINKLIKNNLKNPFVNITFFIL